jgi:hypothetical protein
MTLAPCRIELQKVKVSDTAGDDSSNTAKYKKAPLLHEAL